ncbi:hypothetical protein [Lawsonibacter sp. JLR.KK007]|uniref:hypothetical protein n=1 Tax=Lawsonibacter sp. JLR.KK007 TaxID=3114293 RepID=UPI002FF2D1C1
MNTFLSNAEFDNQRHRGQVSHHDKNVPQRSAHGHGKYQRNHADTRDKAEHTLIQADPVIGDDFKPFFYHAVSHPQIVIFSGKEKATAQ